MVPTFADIQAAAARLKARAPSDDNWRLATSGGTRERDLDAVRAMIDVRGVNDLGIYCDVLEAGRIAVGDAVSVIRPSAAVA